VLGFGSVGEALALNNQQASLHQGVEQRPQLVDADRLGDRRAGQRPSLNGVKTSSCMPARIAIDG
jgi:hypothetical protein